jgi:alanine dehydrogenase
MPAIVSRSASYGLTNSSIKVLNKIADNGFSEVLINDTKLANGVWSHSGYCTNEFLSETFGLNYKKLRIFPTN